MDGKFFINGIDLSEYVEDVRLSGPPEADHDLEVLGLKSLGPITFSGVFGGVRCASCGEIFVPHDLTPRLIGTTEDERRDFGQLCDECGIAFA